MIAIVPANLEFGRLLPRTYTRRIIIHHSASPDVSARVIHGWHLAKGWSGIGYHYVIRADGTVEAGRPLDKIGAHAGAEVNCDSIGVCLTGNFMDHQPTGAQLGSLVQLADYLEYTYAAVLKVLRHKDVAATDCPGELFPWPESSWPQAQPDPDQCFSACCPALPPWKESLLNEAMASNLITETHDPDEPAPCWLVLAVGLNVLKEVRSNESK